MPDNQPLTMGSYPEAILHVDGDAFFSSVEQALHPSLRGQPVVTGKERGIIACASYEAKALGIKRGVRLWEAQKMCPGLVVLPSDYETYSLYSKRMFDIMREYTPIVEEYSIDEGFADIAGMRRVFHMSYEEIARDMQDRIAGRLGITVSIGLSVSKSLAKLASDFKKPNGLTTVPGMHIHHFLKQIPLGDVWGIGPNSTKLLTKYGLKTAYDFVMKPEKWVHNLLGKPGKEIWNELRGNALYEVTTEEKTDFASISKCKTFTAPSNNRNFIYAKLIRLMESAFIKLRRYDLRARKISVGLRKKDFQQKGLTARLNRGTCAVQEAVPVAGEMFDRLFEEGETYRCVIVLLEKIESDKTKQYEFFEDHVRIEDLSILSGVVDNINERYGKHKVSLGSSLYLDNHVKTRRDELPWRKENLLKGETPRKHLNLPRLDIKV